MNSCAPTALRRGLDLLPARRRLAEGDVVGDGPVEHEVLLGDHHHRPTQVVVAEVAQVDPVQRDPAAVGVVEPGHQLGDGRLARTGGADQGDGLAGRDVQLEARQHRAVLRVLELDVLQVHRALGVRERRRRRGLHDARLLLQHPGQLLQRRGGRLEGVVELADVLHRLEEHPQVEQERRQHADGHLALDHPVAAVEQHHADGQVADQLDAGHEDRDQPERVDVGLAVAAGHVLEDLLRCGARGGRPGPPGCRSWSR